MKRETFWGKHGSSAQSFPPSLALAAAAIEINALIGPLLLQQLLPLLIQHGSKTSYHGNASYFLMTDGIRALLVSPLTGSQE